MATKRDFTDRFLKSIKPAEKGGRPIYWDAQVPGFGIRVTDKSTAKIRARSFSSPDSLEATTRPRGELGTTHLHRSPTLGLSPAVGARISRAASIRRSRKRNGGGRRSADALTHLARRSRLTTPSDCRGCAPAAKSKRRLNAMRFVSGKRRQFERLGAPT